METLVKDWMNPRPLTVETRATAAEAKAMMEKYWMRHLLVMEGPTLVGILSDRDIRSISLPPGGQVTAAERQAHLQRQLVGTMMTREPRTVRSETPLREVARLMLEHKFGGVPVVDGGRVMGIITETDILRAFIKLTEVDRPH